MLYVLVNHDAETVSPQCVQTSALVPDFGKLGVHDSAYFAADNYTQHSIELLQGAVRIPTVSYDDMDLDVSKELRFEVFKELHAYLFEKFPILATKVETVNTYGLLYTIKGSNEKLEPVVLMAHQDVVPVAETTIDEWDYPPFEAVYDGEWITGRGVVDTKTSLVGIHEAVEALLEQNWQPERTVLLSFGFYEEISGLRGAKSLAELIHERYGRVEMLIDEGFGVSELYGAYVAAPAVAEKGSVSLRASLSTPGGHSSMPPDNTGIGIIASLARRLENKPLPASLPEVVKQRYACIGENAPQKHKKHKEYEKHEKHKKGKLAKLATSGNKKLGKKLRKQYSQLNSPGRAGRNAVKALTEDLASEITSRILVETSQAIDVVTGGVKINALPEHVVLDAMYRIHPDSSVGDETARYMSVVREVAEQFGLSIVYEGENGPKLVVPAPANLPAGQCGGKLVVSPIDPLEHAPVAPFSADSKYWQLLTGTTQHVIRDQLSDLFEPKPLFSVPNLMTGNTDTARYWNSTSRLYRYDLRLDNDMRNKHTVNEAMRPRSHISSVVFFYEFLLKLPHLDKEE